MKKQIIAIIPARYASSRFPGKMLAEVSGKTVIQHTYESAKRCTLLDDLLIATDDIRIFEHAKSFGAKAVMTSPEHPTGLDRINEVLLRYPEHTDSEIVINVQGDEVCVSHHTIEAVAKALVDNPTELMSTACVSISDPEEILNPSVVKCIFDKNQHALYFSRSPIPGTKPRGTHLPFYYKHLGIYGFRKEFLLEYARIPQTPLQLVEDLEQLKVLESGYKIKVVEVQHQSPHVDIPEDIQRVTEWLCSPK